MKHILFILLLTAIAGSLFAQADLQTVATVNLTRREPITVRQLRVEVEKFEAAAGRTLTASERLEVLNAMIDERLFLQAAARDRVSITDNEVNQQIQQLRGQFTQQLGRPLTETEFAQVVREQYDMDVATFTEQLRKQMLMQKYLMSKKENVLNSARNPTEAEIIEQYNLIKAQLVRPETVRFSMIMIPYGADAASRTSARQLADRLAREIGSNPARFDEVSARSVAPDSGYEAGDAGYIPRNQEARAALGQELLNAAFSTRQGQVSSVIEGPTGFCIVKVTENHAQRNLEMNDIMHLGRRGTVREYITQAIMLERQQEVVARATEELVAELRANNRAVQVNEGNLNW